MLGVAIINYETADLTANCVRSVLVSPPTEPYEIVVVDNGSSASTLAELRAIEGARIVETGVNGGFATGVNRCLREVADADVVVVLNSDTEVEPGALDALAAAARRDGVGLAAPVILERDGHVQRSGHRRFPTPWTTWQALCVPLAFVLLILERWIPHATALSVAEHEAGVRPRHVMGAVMAIRREAFEAAGPFDERYFMYLEETDWQERLARAGWFVDLVPAARVRHLHRGGDEAIGVPTDFYLDSTRRYFGGRGHRDLTIRAMLASTLVVTWVALVVYGPFSRLVPGHRRIVVASRPRALHALRHVASGRWKARPDGRDARTGAAGLRHGTPVA